MKRLLLILMAALSSSNVFAQRATLDETARFLAGIPVTGPLAPLTHDPAWLDHARNLDSAWFKKDYFQIRPIRAWMLANASEYYASTNSVFYMFSGPDFLYANLFYPRARTYILAGLEPVGQVPDLSRMDPAALRTDLNALRNSMHTVLQTHYFITKDMRTDLTSANLGGTLPDPLRFSGQNELHGPGYHLREESCGGCEDQLHSGWESADSILLQDRPFRRPEPFPKVVCRTRAREQLVESRLLPDAYRRILRGAQFSSEQQPRHYPG